MKMSMGMRVKKAVAMILAAGMLAAALPAGAMAAKRDQDTDRAVLGILTENGYENSYAGFRCTLPQGYVVDNRSAFQAVGEQTIASVIEDSNSEGTLSMLAASFPFGGSATAFSAGSETDTITIYVETFGIGYDHWEDEETIADNSLTTTFDNLEAQGTAESPVIDIHVNKVQTNFMGQDEWGIEYSCVFGGVDVFGRGIYKVCGDYLITVDLVSTDYWQLDTLAGYFEKM